MFNVTQDIEIIQILNKNQSCALLNNQSSPFVSSDLSYTDYSHFLSLQKWLTNQKYNDIADFYQVALCMMEM